MHRCALEVFFQQLERTKRFSRPEPTGTGLDAVGLNHFLCALREADFSRQKKLTDQSRPAASSFNFRHEQISDFFAQLDVALAAELQAGARFNPWEAMEVGRREVRCCEVLSWLLKPSASHGLGVMALNGLLSLLRGRANELHTPPLWVKLPEKAAQECTVLCETPAGPASSRRLDISIIDPAFEIVIEAKVGAKEGKNQVEEYCQKLDTRLGSKLPWLLVFLTRGGAEPESAGIYKESRVVAVSWSELAQSLTDALWPELSRQDVKTPGLHARNHFVRTLLKKMKNLSGGK